jgi:hypothetical protein
VRSWWILSCAGEDACLEGSLIGAGPVLDFGVQGGGHGDQGGGQAQVPVGGGRGAVAVQVVDAARHVDRAALDRRLAAHRRRGQLAPSRSQGVAVLPDRAGGGRGHHHSACVAGATRGEGCVAAQE